MARKKKMLPGTWDEIVEIPEAERPFEIPGHWKWVRMGDCVVRERDKTTNFAKYNNYIGLEHMRAGGGLLEAGSAEGIKSIKSKVYPGQILYGKLRPYLNKHAICNVEAVCSTDIVVYSPGKLVSAEYVDYYLGTQYFIDYASGLAKGINLPRVSASSVEAAPFPLPPLEEQLRIVERLESLNAKLDEAESSLQKVIEGSEQRRASLLEAAFQGELTNKRKDVQGVSAFAAWEQCELGELLVGKPRNGYSPAPVDYATPYKSLSLSAVTSGVFRSEFYKYIARPIEEDSYLWLSPGDILVQRANSIDKVGSSAIFDGPSHEFVYPDLMMKLRVNKRALTPFVAYQLKSNKVMTHFRKNATGTAGNMPKINQKTVVSAPMVLPPLDEQKEIVGRLDTLMARERSIMALTTRSLEQLSVVRRSILHEAMRGRL